MTAQTIIIIILFIGALTYLFRMIFKTLNAKSGCASNCKCGVDFSGVEAKKKAEIAIKS
jgi:branched-subunit amino acid transport protein